MPWSAVKSEEAPAFLTAFMVFSELAAIFRKQPRDSGLQMLTNKGKYGLKAMVHLAGLEVGALAQVQDMADANAIPKKFLDQILSELRNAGLAFSKKGKGGGYALARPASQITVGQIVRVLDGPLAPIQCASVTAYRACDDCSDERACAVRLVMVKARNAIADVLDRHTLADMRALAAEANADLTFHI
jgi:Rrf2 family protein